ncbi:MAG: S41 family peptidase, partial [Planctomycetota bacterium]|nr:S41 family peptidase [Planctomycetota bacterium]
GIGESKQMTDQGYVLRWMGIPSPDGKFIVHADKNQTLWILDVESGDDRQIDESGHGDFRSLDWSPDSKWLAYAKTEDNLMQRLWLHSPIDQTHIALTSDRTLSGNPTWSSDGDWLYFLSDRHLETTVGSPWGPWQPQPHFERTTEIYMLALREGLHSPFAPATELDDQEKDKEEKPNAKDDDEEGEGEGEDNEDEKPPLQIDLDGIAGRLHKLPVPNGDYSNLFATKDRLFWTASDDGRSLMMLKITNEKPKAKVMVAGIRNAELSADGKKILVRKGNALHVIASSGGAPTKLENTAVNLSGWTFSMDPREEWQQMFVDAWRLERDYFYDQNMHGLDWPAMLEKYRPLAERVTTRAELSDVIAQMVAELSALHTFVRGGDTRRGDDNIAPASLGARLTRDEASGGFRVDRIYQSDPDYPDQAAPLAKPGVNISEGDVIEMINGVPTLSVAHCGELLRNQSGKQVRLRVKPHDADESRDVIVTPISSRGESILRYGDWEYTRRQIVEDQGAGDLGYIHLRAMGSRDINQWAREFYPIFDRKGLIIDVRYNRGGNIDSWILGQLLRKAWFYFQGRVGDPTWNMQYAFRGHMVILCNERTASDGEAIAEGFRRLGMGPVIGTRSWGGEIWLSSNNFLADRGIATAAEYGVYGPEGIWLIEGHGVDPDIVVDNLPHATFNGADAQLAAAIEYLQRKIEEEPIEVPEPPAHPDHSFEK